VGVKVFVFLTILWNYILFLRKSKNGNWDGVIKNYTFGEYPAVLTKSIYWPKRHLASKSEQWSSMSFLIHDMNPVYHFKLETK
jgi:hypothetical protein